MSSLLMQLWGEWWYPPLVGGVLVALLVAAFLAWAYVASF